MARTSERGLTYLQVLLLIIAFSGASVLIFLFGYGVGQDMALRTTMQSERVVRGPAAARPATPVPTAGVDANFYKQLQERAEKQLDAEAAAAASPTAVVVPPTATAIAIKPTATKPSPRATATRKPTPPRLPTVAAPPPPPRATSAPIAGQTRWSIEVVATRNAQDAIAVTLELRRQGYQAFTAQAPQGNETSYRVRVGRFAGREEAEAVLQKLRRDPRFSGASLTAQ